MKTNNIQMKPMIRWNRRKSETDSRQGKGIDASAPVSTSQHKSAQGKGEMRDKVKI